MTFITNFCVNPSFEVSLEGYTGLLGAELTQTSSDSVAGQYSMQVQTPGLHTGEGFIGPQGVFPAAATGAVSVYLKGETGTVEVSAVSNPGGVLLGSQDVQLTWDWGRVILGNLSIAAGAEVYLLVQTPSAQDITFLVDSVQYEPESPARQYIDGDSYQCEWLGTPGLSASEMPLQNPVMMIGGLSVEASVNFIVPGSVSVFSVTGYISTDASVVPSAAWPMSAFDDFAIYEATDPDPAMTYVAWNNAGSLSGQAEYARNWMSIVPPLDYPVSDGSLLWPRAAYMAAGFEFSGIESGAEQNTTNVQVEHCPLAGNSDQTPGPSNWDNPRAIHTIIKPTRLNYSPNPSFETDLSNWSAAGSASVSRDSSESYGIAGYWDGQAIPEGQWSLRLVTTDATGMAELLVPYVIYGDVYIFSTYILPGSGVTGAVLNVNEGTILDQGIDTSDPVWLRPWISFQTNASTISLTVQPDIPGTIWVDCNLIESGELLGAYFDGEQGSNPDYLWETDGTPGSTRSYYYEGFSVNQTVVADILTKQIPLGISAAAPLFAIPPTQ